jgi:hypothetical protein
VFRNKKMPSTDATAPAQVAAALSAPSFSPQAVELQVRRLLQRFAMPPATAALIASLAYAGARA